MIYGAETWATTKKEQKILDVNGMRRLRWMCVELHKTTRSQMNSRIYVYFVYAYLLLWFFFSLYSMIYMRMYDFYMCIVPEI